MARRCPPGVICVQNALFHTLYNRFIQSKPHLAIFSTSRGLTATTAASLGFTTAPDNLAVFAKLRSCGSNSAGDRPIFARNVSNDLLSINPLAIDR